MYFPSNFCCICTEYKSILKNLTDSDDGNFFKIYFVKLTSCVPEYNFPGITNQKICRECCMELNLAYRFLKSRTRAELAQDIEQSKGYKTRSIRKENPVTTCVKSEKTESINIKSENDSESSSFCKVMIKKEEESEDEEDNSNTNILRSFRKKCLRNKDSLLDLLQQPNSTKIVNRVATLHKNNITVHQNGTNFTLTYDSKKSINEMTALPQLDEEIMLKDEKEDIDFQNKNSDENFCDPLAVKGETFDPGSQQMDLPELKYEIIIKKDEDFCCKDNLKQDEVYDDSQADKIPYEDCPQDEEYIVTSSTEEKIKNKRKVMDLQSPDSQQRLYECKHCPRKFPHLSHLSNHMRAHTDGKLRPCNICQKSFAQKDYYDHMSLHSDEKSHECPICSKRFSKLTLLNEHMRRTHNDNKPVTCKVCSKEFTCIDSLIYHMKIHTSRGNYKCKICMKRFAFANKLTLHKRIHSEERPFSCISCGKTFSHFSSMRRHVETHDKVYECEFCQEKFTDMRELKKHIKTHTAKSLQCDSCGKKFSQLSHLNVHQRIHTGVMPYECFICDKKFKQSSALSTHMRTHTGEKPYQCHVCDREFSLKASLNRHMSTH